MIGNLHMRRRSSALKATAWTCMAAGLLAAAAPAHASNNSVAQWTFATLVTGQAWERGSTSKPVSNLPKDPYGTVSTRSATDTAGSRQTAPTSMPNYLVEARKAIVAGNFARAEQMVAEERKLQKAYPLGADTPSTVAAAIEEAKSLFAVPKSPQAAGNLATFYQEQATIMRGQGETQTADVADNRARFFAGQSQQVAPTNTPANNGLTTKQQAKQLVAQAQVAMDRGDLKVASDLAKQANALRVPEREWQEGELRPYFLMMEIDRAMRHAPVQQAPVQQASNTADNGSAYPINHSVYTPNNDNSRNVPASAMRQADGVAPLQASGQSMDGQQLFDMGMKALEQRDGDTALEYFRQAWRHEEELNPYTRQVLQDKLAALQRTQMRPPTVPSPLADLNEQQRLLRDQKSREVRSELVEVRDMRKDQPRAALQRSLALREATSNSGLDSVTQKQLVSMVDREISDLQSYIESNIGQIELDESNAAVLAKVEADRAKRMEIQTKLATLVEEFNVLTDEKRFAEAEIIARQAVEIAPDEGISNQLLIQAQFARKIYEQEQIRERNAEGFYRQMTNVEKSAEGFDDNEPFQFGDARRWEQISIDRKRWAAEGQRRLSGVELEIQEKLKKQVDVRFNNVSLGEVMQTLSATTGVNIFLDPQGLHAEGVTTDNPISINLTQPVSLRSALNLILNPLRLNYSIQNEVLRITSAAVEEQNTYSRVYYVADLVMPIPNFTPSYNLGLPGAIRESYRTIGYGGGAGGGSFSGPLTLADSGGSTGAGVLANMRGNDSYLNPLSQKPMDAGPGGLGGGSQADFDTLIDLITSTIAPTTWDEVGGSGSVEGFDTNLSLVVSQTQDVHEQIADLLDQLRRLQDLQVTIEVRFITISDSFFERIGINFNVDIDDNVSIFPGDDSGPSATVGLDATGAPTSDLDLSFTQGSFGSTTPAFGGFDAATAANFGFAILSDIEVFFLLQAAQGDTRTNVLQAPKVTLFNGQQAFISDTSQRPFVTSVVPVVGDFAAAQQPVIVVLSEGTSLSVQAVVSNDRRFVRLNLVPFFSTIGDVQEFTFTGSTTTDSGTGILDPAGMIIGRDDQTSTTSGTTVQLPEFNFTTVTTTVSVPDGGTVLLGGIKRLSEGRNERGVPMLSKLPYVNRLFRNVGIGRETSSLMMMVTPRIIIQEEEEERTVGRPLN
jgi:general secretion pathway protein D